MNIGIRVLVEFQVQGHPPIVYTITVGGEEIGYYNGEELDEYNLLSLTAQYVSYRYGVVTAL